MFADVILHRKMPAKFESFTYKIPEGMTLEPGQFVNVPFRKQKIAGVTRTIHDQPPKFQTREISSAFELKLHPNQLALAGWINSFYECGFAKAINLFIPEKIWPGKKTKALPASITNIDSCFSACRQAWRRNDKNKTALKKLVNKLMSSPSKKLIFEKTPLPRPAFYKELISKLKPNNQALFLFPEIFHLNQLASDFPNYHGELKKSKKAALWESSRLGIPKAIAGSRLALFLPFKKLSCIVLDFEEHESYLEKRNPKYDALKVAEKLAEFWKIPLIAISRAPRTETWHKAAIGAYEKHDWSHGASRQANTAIIDMKNEKKKNPDAVFADYTVSKIAGCLTQDKQILIFLNRLGEAGALVCKDCGNVIRCPKCNSALVLHADGTMKCHRCKTNVKAPASCNVCRGLLLKPIGIGTEGLEKEIKKIFGKANVLRVDRETLPKRKNKLDEKKMQKADILIATQIINKPLALPRLQCCVAMAPDQMLNISDFRAGERLFQLLSSLENLLNSASSQTPEGHAELIIQTLLPEHSLYAYFAKNQPEKFYEEELAIRKQLSLPPFGITQEPHHPANLD